MAHITWTGDASLFHRTLNAVKEAGMWLGKAIVINSTAEARFREVSRLQALSDDDLVKLGLSRDRIVHHVFRDIYSI